MDSLRIGVLALQGNFREHAAMLRRLGAEVVEVRKAEQLEGLDGLVIPGGESTTIMRLARLYGLDQAIRHFPGALLGTCAGMIVLDRNHLDVVDIEVDRNAYGRQVASFEADLGGSSEGEPLRGVFIRAPRVRDVGPEVEVLAELDGEPVLLREGRVLVASFHPELTGDTRVHERFLELVRQEKLPPRVTGASLAKETSDRRAGQYTEVRPSAASDVSCRQRRQDRICRQHRRAKPVGAPLDQEPGAEAGSAGP